MDVATTAAEPTRRDFLYLATGAVGAVGVAAAIWPFISQMNPDADTIAQGAPVALVAGIVAEMMKNHDPAWERGWIAERHPSLVRHIVADGHELASHGYGHAVRTGLGASRGNAVAFIDGDRQFRVGVDDAPHALRQHRVMDRLGDIVAGAGGERARVQKG